MSVEGSPTTADDESLTTAARRLAHRVRPDGVGWFVVASYLAFAVANFLRIMPNWSVGGMPYFDDSRIYARDAGNAIWSLDLWGGTYPFGYPLTVRLFGDGVALHLVQVGASAAAWTWLAVEAARCVHRGWLRVVVMAWVLGLSLTPQVAVQHQLVMTESLSISSFVALVALGLRWRRTGNHQLLWASVPLAILWLEYRKSNVILVLAFVLVMAIVAVRLRSRRAAGIALVAMLMVVGMSWTGSRTSQSGQTLTKWVLRVGIPTPEIRSFLIDAGMPDDSVVLEQGGPSVDVDQLAYDPRLSEFRGWLRDDASGAYVRWLLSDPSQLTIDGLRSLSTSFSATNPSAEDTRVLKLVAVGNNKTEAPRAPLGQSVGAAIWMHPHPLLVWWVALAVASATLAGRRRRRTWNDPLWLLGWFLLVLAPLHALVSYYGDMVAQVRHGIGAAVQLRVALVLLSAFALDALVRRLEAGSSDRDEAGPEPLGSSAQQPALGGVPRVEEPGQHGPIA